MYHILGGKQRSLKFPIMCNGCVKLDYSDNIPDTNNNNNASDDIAYGLWAHKGSFTFESIITPYDINGYGGGWDDISGVVSGRSFSDTPPDLRPTPASTKIMPAGNKSTSQNVQFSNNYLSMQNAGAGRFRHEMMIFYNANFQVSLLNNTEYNQNQPADYAIRVRIKTPNMATATEITTDNVISPTNDRSFIYSATDGIEQLEGFDTSGRLKYWKVNTVGNLSNSGSQISLSSNSVDFVAGVGQEVYRRVGNKFVLLGKINTKTASSIFLTQAHNTTFTAGESLYVKSYQEPTYINKLHQISCVYDNLTKKISIFLDSILIKEQILTATDDFEFDRTDIFLGANGTNATGAGSATTNKQFMGELHEMYIARNPQNKVRRHSNLVPNYNDTLMYLRFEEVDA